MKGYVWYRGSMGNLRQRAPSPLTLLHDGDLGVFEGARDDQVVFGHYRRHNTWSPELLALLRAQLGMDSGTGTFIDVGANIGLVSIPIARRTDARVYAFEPVPANHALLRRNVVRHQLEDQIVIFQCAAYDSAGEVAMNLSANNHGDHRVAARPSLHQDALPVDQILVQAARIADCLKDQPRPGRQVMKMDTQGCEQKALTGTAALLGEIDALVVEYWPLGLSNQGNSLDELNRTLRQFPYAKILSHTRQVDGDLEPSANLLDRLFNLLAPTDPGFFDLLLTRER